MGIEPEMLAHVPEGERPLVIVRTHPRFGLPDEARPGAVPGGEAADGVLQDRQQERLLTTDETVVARGRKLRREELLGHEQGVLCVSFRLLPHWHPSGRWAAFGDRTGYERPGRMDVEGS